MSSLRKNLILMLGNPLLDIETTVSGDFLTKYGLEPNNAILAEEKHNNICQDMIDTFHHVDYVPGGSTQNTARVLQWLLQTPHVVTYFGSIGVDTFGGILTEKVAESGVNAVYQRHPEQATGTCAVLLTERKRSLVAFLGAAGQFTVDHVNDPTNWAIVEDAKFFYMAGFFLTSCAEAAVKVSAHAAATGKPFALNLSAPFISQFFKQQMHQVLPNVDVVFGNESEADAFAEANEYGTTNREEIALKLAAEPKTTSRSRIAIVTQGDLPVIVAQDGVITLFDVPQMSNEEIVDTNGAGDAFSSGFLAQFIQGKSIEECVRCGTYAAQVVIARLGCSVPDKPSFK